MARSDERDAEKPKGAGDASGEPAGSRELDDSQLDSVSGGAGGGSGAGKVGMQDFHFTKTWDKSSAS